MTNTGTGSRQAHKDTLLDDKQINARQLIIINEFVYFKWVEPCPVTVDCFTETTKKKTRSSWNNEKKRGKC